MPWYKHGLIAGLIVCALSPFSAGAVGLGEIRITSSLGERFRAEIPVRNPSPDTSSGCFHVTSDSPDAIAEAPWLSEVHLAFMPDPPRLVVTSRRQAIDPVVQLAIYTGCGAYLTRHYVALLSPPKDQGANLPTVARVPGSREDSPPAQPQKPVAKKAPATSAKTGRAALPGETSADMARRLYPRSQAAQRRFVRQMVAANPDWLTSTDGDEVLPEGVELHYPPPPPRRPPVVRPAEPGKVSVANGKPEKKEEKSDRLVLSPSESSAGENLPVTATTAEISRRLGDVETQINSMRSQLNALRAEYPAPPPAIQTLLAEMETRLLAVELNVARINLANLASETPPAAPVPALIDEAKAPAAEKPASLPTAPSPQPPAIVEKPAPQGLDIGIMLLGVLGLGVGLSVVLYRRSTKRVSLDSMSGVQDGAEEPPERAKQERAVMHQPSPKPSGMQATVAEAAEKKPPVKGGYDPEEVEQPVELANIMIVYGQTQSAMEVLRNFIEAHPKKSLRTALRLLELYKMGNMRDEFDALAGLLPSRFNIERVQWDDVQALSENSDLADERADIGRRADLIAQLPSPVQAYVVGHWGAPECLVFLNRLLSDKRDGAPKGLGFVEIRAILRLVKLLESEVGAVSS